MPKQNISKKKEMKKKNKNNSRKKKKRQSFKGGVEPLHDEKRSIPLSWDEGLSDEEIESRTSMFSSNLLILADVWAPLFSHSLILSILRLTRLLSSLLSSGLYVPNFSINRPSLGILLSAATTL